MTLLATSCVLDSDDRCSDGQYLYEDGVCVCEEGSLYTPQGCVRCGENEVAGAGECTCAEGYERSGSQCVPAAPADGLGEECSAEMACDSEGFQYCQLTDDGGYCTRTGCSSADDCPGSYDCDAAADPPYCRRPPIGLGEACSTQADCADGEAKFCDMVVSNTCLQQDCSLADQDCFGGQQCCDLSSFGVPVPVCLPPGSC